MGRVPASPYLLQLWLLSFLPRAAWNSSRRNFVGCDIGVQPEQTNTDLSEFRLEERGFRVKRVALAATGTPRLKANKSHHVFSPFFSSESFRAMPSTLPWYYGHPLLLRLSMLKTFESELSLICSISYFLTRTFYL